MSLRSFVKRSNACSIVAFSVLASTTRKFFWLSGAGVTCCSGLVSADPVIGRIGYAHADASKEQAGHRVLSNTISEAPMTRAVG